MWWVGVSTAQGRTSVSFLKATLLSTLVFPCLYSEHGIYFFHELAVGISADM